MMRKLAVVITHPIQYYVPVFKLLAQQCHLKVFYTWGKDWLTNRYDPGFEKTVEWDIPLLDGYEYEFAENTSKEPGSHHNKGIINPLLIESIKKFHPTAVLVHGYAYTSHLKVLRFFKGRIPVWFRGDSTLLNEKPGLKSLIKKIYLKWIYSHVDKAFYVGTNSKAYFKKFGLKNNQLVFSPHAIDNHRFSTADIDEVNAFKLKLGVTDKDLLILYAGKFEDVKNLPILIEAFNLFEVKQNNIKLLLVGNGPQEKHLKNLANSNANILFMGFQNQRYLPVIYHACDIFCLPSKSETWGLAINEAMAAGKGILASNKTGSAIDLVKDGENGFIFNYNDVITLNKTLAFLLSNTECIKKYGQRSKEIVKDWSFENQVKIILEQLNEC